MLVNTYHYIFYDCSINLLTFNKKIKFNNIYIKKCIINELVLDILIDKDIIIEIEECVIYKIKCECAYLNNLMLDNCEIYNFGELNNNCDILYIEKCKFTNTRLIFDTINYLLLFTYCLVDN